MAKALEMHEMIAVIKNYNQQSRKQTLLETARHPLSDHAYHKKTNAELEYIVKDAGEAAKAMQGHNPAAEAKYLDQVNDATTVLAYRKQHGMPDWYKEKYNLKEDENLEEIGKVGTALGAAGMAAAALAGAGAPAAAQTTTVRPDIFVQYDQASLQKNFAADISAAMKAVPSMTQKLQDIQKNFNDLKPQQKQLVANLQTGMKLPSDAGKVVNWINFTARNVDLAGQM